MSRLYHLRVRNYRGIRELDWAIGGQTACLVGPGNSTKTTLLDAVQLALSPRWSVVIDDSDFHQGVTDSPVRIEATVGDLPAEFLSQDRYGLHLRGWSESEGLLREEPQQGDVRVLTVAVTVDGSLEPSWEVVTAPTRHPPGKRIPAKDRACLGVARVGAFADRDLGWGRGSILSRVTHQAGGTRTLLADLGRAAKGALNVDDIADLQAVASEAERLGRALGVAPTGTLQPHIDIAAVNVAAGGLTLHDGQVPIRRAGLGARRLLALALQMKLAQEQGITLVDEVEHGLEPYRVRHLVRALRDATGQALMATHSAVVLGELDTKHLAVVRSEGGRTTVRRPPPELRRFIRGNTEAFLSQKVLVCEGKTEMGICASIDAAWASAGRAPFACLGVGLADGGGSDQGSVASAFRKLGFQVALLGDSDRPFSPTPDELRALGVTVIQWADDLALEERLAVDLPQEALFDLVRFAVEEGGLESVRSQVSARAGNAALADNVEAWFEQLGEERLRQAVGTAAKRSGWFKRFDLALELGRRVVMPARTSIRGDLDTKLSQLEHWVHG